ncbi:hypothetical protein SBA1_90102 [Candidatus Sulfotelmatobacter kueseliae]|uniref:Uncharacterized protein n=1 Tax=Candidatus Sulfotelmatobacter kueseliae TaxID=2042962 RepID=A0A2U3LAP5_9BACT|nr:hypothetical protein SBA1_90102 [Candidatus Sulfotelmatobacter kueseliae]
MRTASGFRPPASGFLRGVILSAAVFQAERRILRRVQLGSVKLRARSLARLVKAPGFGMTQSGRQCQPSLMLKLECRSPESRRCLVRFS